MSLCTICNIWQATTSNTYTVYLSLILFSSLFLSLTIASLHSQKQFINIQFVTGCRQLTSASVLEILRPFDDPLVHGPTGHIVTVYVDKPLKEQIPVVWEWQQEGDTWVPYDQQTCTMLERALVTGEQSVVLDFGTYAKHRGYIINFTEMSQQNNSTNTKRKVRRTHPRCRISDTRAPIVWVY